MTSGASAVNRMLPVFGPNLSLVCVPSLLSWMPPQFPFCEHW